MADDKFMDSFRKTFGAKSISCAADQVYEVIPTGSLTLDDALGSGGYVEGRLTEIWGVDAVGKRLRIDEPVPTPDGWSTMGALDVGDRVFDRFGNPCRVTWVSQIELAPESYELRFDVGDSIQADAEHQWITVVERDRSASMCGGGSRKVRAKVSATHAPGVVTTRQIVGSLHAPHYPKREVANHAIPMQQPLKLPERDLLVDPWVLGLWLGDGTTSSGGITLNRQDAGECLHRLTAAGFDCSLPPSGDMPGSVGVTPLGLRLALRGLGVLGFKHVPDEYLRSSEQQRWDLLTGMMDSDGYAPDGGGALEFCTTSKSLADGFCELAHSLGLKIGCAEGIAMLNGREIGPKWRVTFYATRNPFSVSRKADRWLPPKTMKPSYRFITGAVPVEPTPMRCIAVDSPDSSYLAGRQMLPTHNTSLAMIAVANAQQKYPKRGCAWIDMEHVFDNSWAVAHGVDLDRLFLITPDNAESVADQLKMLLVARDRDDRGLCSMVVLDSIGAMIPEAEKEKDAEQVTIALQARVVTRMVKIAAVEAAKGGTAVLFLNQVRANLAYGSDTTTPGGFALKHVTTHKLKVRRGQSPPRKARVPGEKEAVEVGYELAVLVERNKVAPPRRSAHFTLLHTPSEFGPVGIDRSDEATSVGIRTGVIEQAGAWYTLPDGRRFQGRESVIAALRDDPEVVEVIRAKALAGLPPLVEESGLVADADE